jgi:hypothetical protein
MPERLKVSECRNLLADEASDVSESALIQLRDGTYDLASLLIEAYVDFRQKSENLGSSSTTPVDLILSAMRQQFLDDGDDPDSWEDEDFEITYSTDFEIDGPPEEV